MDTEIEKMYTTDHPYPLRPDPESPNEYIFLHIAARQRARKLGYIDDTGFPGSMTSKGREYITERRTQMITTKKITACMITELQKMQATNEHWTLEQDLKDPNESALLFHYAKQRAKTLNYIDNNTYYGYYITYEGLEYLEQLLPDTSYTEG